jgi:hypothetical protein
MMCRCYSQHFHQLIYSEAMASVPDIAQVIAAAVCGEFQRDLSAGTSAW